MTLSPSEMEELRLARHTLENPGLAAKISDLLGAPIEKGFEMLPRQWNAIVNGATRKSIRVALNTAIRTMDTKALKPPANRWHKLAACATGAVGGAFGLPALAIELPVSTTIMLRSIADIARSEGESLELLDTRLQCVQVLALGGTSKGDDAAETGYFAARAAMAMAISDAAAHLSAKGFSGTGAPVIVRLISQIASRFSVVVSEKVAAQTVPILGAFGGAALNALFINHFQAIGKGHFTVRRLERHHGTEEVRRLYDLL